MRGDAVTGTLLAEAAAAAAATLVEINLGARPEDPARERARTARRRALEARDQVLTAAAYGATPAGRSRPR